MNRTIAVCDRCSGFGDIGEIYIDGTTKSCSRCAGTGLIRLDEYGKIIRKNVLRSDTVSVTDSINKAIKNIFGDTITKMKEL